jgi:sirohydrochlorin ferrochelatase
MTIALIDNGSLEAAAHKNLRAVAAALSERTGVNVHPVSWKHSDRIALDQLDGTPAWTLAPFIRALVGMGQREFVFVPFFISAQGAIGSALRSDLEKLRAELGGFNFTFTDGLAARGALTPIVVARLRETLTAVRFAAPPPVVVVDHGGPSAASAMLRNLVAAEVRVELGAEIGLVAAASLEGGEHPHSRPLVAEQLAAPGFDAGDVVLAPLFLSPGRHAGPEGDLARIALATAGAPEDGLASRRLRYHFTGLVGTHPLAVVALAAALRDTLSQFPSSILQ